MADKKDDDKDLKKAKDDAREDQLLADEKKKAQELEKLDAKEDKADGKGDPSARLKDAGKDGESEGMYRMDEREHMRTISDIRNKLDDHHQRISNLEGRSVDDQGNPNIPVQPIGITQNMIQDLMQGMLAGRDIAKDFKGRYPNEDVGQVTAELVKKGINLNDPKHAGFINNLSLEPNAGELYKRLNERPDLIEDVVTMHPSFHDRILSSLKKPLKGKAAEDISDAPKPVESKPEAKANSSDDIDTVVSNIFARKYK